VLFIAFDSPLIGYKCWISFSCRIEFVFWSMWKCINTSTWLLNNCFPQLVHPKIHLRIKKIAKTEHSSRSTKFWCKRYSPSYGKSQVNLSSSRLGISHWQSQVRLPTMVEPFPEPYVNVGCLCTRLPLSSWFKYSLVRSSWKKTNFT